MTAATAANPIEILLVEDNPGDVILTREVLAELPAPVNLTVATDGEQAMALLRGDGGPGGRFRPGLILLDINLPIMSGHEVLAALKSDPQLRRIPVVALTSSSADKDVLAAYDHCINAYITKPVDLEEFIEAMRSMQGFWFKTARTPPVSNEPGDANWHASREEPSDRGASGSSWGQC
jgi:chemotaxis family two-component system response regulator Rcp1